MTLDSLNFLLELVLVIIQSIKSVQNVLQDGFYVWCLPFMALVHDVIKGLSKTWVANASPLAAAQDRPHIGSSLPVSLNWNAILV